jgi:hypothetical protein
MDTQTFINQVSTGDAVGAKDLLNSLLSNKAFEVLDAKKIQMAQAIFSGEEFETQDTEQTGAE